MNEYNQVNLSEQVNHYHNQQVPYMHGNNVSVLKNAQRIRSGSMNPAHEIALKPNQVSVNPVEVSRKTIDQHKPAGSLSSLARESYNMTIQ